jgi:type I restriction enzyme S subunit
VTAFVQKNPLGNFASVIAGQSPEGSFYNDKGHGLPFYQGKKDFGDRELRSPTAWTTQITKEALPGDILMSVRAPVGPVNFSRERICIGRGLAAIRCRDGLSQDFLFYQLLGMQSIIAGKEGAVFSSINKAEIEALPIVVPSLEEQRRIVTILDEAFEGIAIAKANVEKNLQNSREIFSGRMQFLFQQNENWERVPLQVLLERGWITSHLDGNHGSEYPRKEEFVESGVPYIAAAAIRESRVDFSEAKYLSPSRAAFIRKGLAKDRDVLFAHNATVGPVAILRTDEEFVILGTSLTKNRCDPQHICPEYLAHYMVSPEFTSQYVQVMRQSTRNQVPITKQREFLHVIPPIDIQMRIAEELDELSIQTARLANVAERKIDAFDELKKTLLNQAFTGQL